MVIEIDVTQCELCWWRVESGGGSDSNGGGGGCVGSGRE